MSKHITAVEANLNKFLEEKFSCIMTDREEMIQVNKLIEKYGYWNEHPKYTAADWIEKVQAEDTRLGYWHWVNGQILHAPNMELLSQGDNP